MTQMARLLLLIALVILISPAPLLAQFDDGVAALQQGDYEKARAAWQTDADAGDGRAQYSMGYLYQFGLGVPVDYATAKEWYEKAAAQNNADAIYALGLLYEAGKAVPRDLARALDYYHKAAEIGQADAEYAVGRMILRGRGVPRDPKEGVAWLKKAASHGQPAAQYMLGAAYEAGWGLPPDPVEALYWYNRSLEGDAVELQEQDMAFQPKIAIASLRRRLYPEEIARVEARLKKDLATGKNSAKSAKSSDKSKPKADEHSDKTVSQNQQGRPTEDGLPGAALTRPQP
ncbi:tetratricopeptide repeat protein [Telmatospirillum sp.]|uniref:tetratricopeptide repeat protein n=1 Tax=Telmatospirillum sp. TaxID=2079197 RepID=UPI002846A3CA|nr:tetratricopeptide repeat protein [Telmatospirillum sp.]MDR3437751.1 tetratricopeptide repeat protein [Telmatospirillum sp.]